MIVYLEVAVIWFVLGALAHWVVAIYSRSVRREKLEKQFDTGDVPGVRDVYIEQGLQQYEHGLRRRLIGLIWVLPAVVFVAVVYHVNFG